MLTALRSIAAAPQSSAGQDTGMPASVDYQCAIDEDVLDADWKLFGLGARCRGTDA